MATPAALQKQRAIIPLVDGLDLKTAEGAVQPLKLLELQNADLSEPGIIKKDWGYIAADETIVGGGSFDGTLRRVFGDGQSEMVASGRSFYERTSSNYGGAAFVADSSAAVDSQIVTSSAEPYSAAFGGSVFFDMARDSGGRFDMILYGESTSFSLAIRDVASGAIVTTLSVAPSAGGVPRVLSVGAYLIGVWIDAGDLKAVAINAGASLAAISPAAVTVANDVAATKLFDACSDGTYWWVAYHSTTNVKVAKCTTALAVLASTTTAGDPDRAIAIAVNTAATYALVAWGNSVAGMSVAGINYVAVTVANTRVENAGATAVYRIAIGDAGDGTTCYLFYEDRTGGTIVRRNTIGWTGAADIGTRRDLYGHKIAHRAFTRDGNVLVGLFHSQSPEELFALCAFDPSSTLLVAAIGHAFYETAVLFDSMRNGVANAVLFDDGYLWCCSEETSESYAADGIDALRIARWEFYAASLVNVGKTPMFPGNAYERIGLVRDVAFPFAPVIESVTGKTTGTGGLVGAASYQWVAVYEMGLTDGSVARSAPSAPVSLTLGGLHDGVDIVVTCPLGRYMGGAGTHIRLYRTEASGTLHYAAATDTTTLRTARTATISDVESDATVAARWILYTDGDTLPNYPPPMGKVWTVHQDRVWSIDAANGELRYTKELVRGEGPAWHPNLSVDCRTDGIEPRSIVSSAQGLWVLGEDASSGRGAIALLVGDGPNDQGNGSSYTLQRLDGCVVGATNHRAVVQCPIGILFVDDRHGIHLLPNGGGAPVYVGAPIERDYQENDQTVVCATLMEDRKEVRFCCSSGLIFVYNYERNLWSKRALEDAVSGDPELIVDACVWDGKHVIATSDGRVLVHGDTTGQYANAYREAAYQYGYLSFRITTAWIKLDDFGGLARIWDLYLLGKFYAPHALTVTIAYDFNDDDTDQFDFSQSDIASVATAGTYEVRVHLRKQKARAIKITIEDAAATEDSDGGAVATSATGEGFGLYAIRMHYGTLGRASKLPSYAAKG